MALGTYHQHCSHCDNSGALTVDYEGNPCGVRPCPYCDKGRLRHAVHRVGAMVLQLQEIKQQVQVVRDTMRSMGLNDVQMLTLETVTSHILDRCNDVLPDAQ